MGEATMKKKSVTIATCQTYPHPSPSLELLIASLKDAGVTAAFVPWATTPIDAYADVDLVLPLCCWDSHHNPVAFSRWLDELERKQVPLLNDKQTVVWNLKKTYLTDIAAKGALVPQSQHIEKVSREEIAWRMETAGWSSAVLKPIYGEGGDGVALLYADSAEKWKLDRWLDHGALLQEFQSDIASYNETTLFFVDGNFSHAVRRHLPEGEWRANLQYGATLARVEVDQSYIKQAAEFLSYAPSLPLYARVDGILRPKGLMVMELELIDPYPHLEFAEGSSDVLANAIVKRLHSMPDRTRFAPEEVGIE
jgi:glutathione synthase/RimK-type ligase-like ATP-grasp enzyme